MPRSTKEEALETRNRILDAAENVFHARGVAGTSLADVAEAANVTRGAIYWHFKNKSDLFDAMCDRVRLPMETMSEADAGKSDPDPLANLRKIAIYLLRETMCNPHSRKVLDILFHKCEFVNESDPIFQRQRECFLHGSEKLERLLTNAIARGQLPADLDIRLAASLFRSSVDGLMNNWLFAPEAFNLDEMAERLVDACLDMLRYAPSLRRAPE